MHSRPDETLLQSLLAVEVTIEEKPAKKPTPLIQYSTFRSMLPAASPALSKAQREQLHAQILEEKAKLEPLMNDIFKDLETLRNTSIKTLLIGKFQNDVRNIPDLQEAISQSQCDSLMTKECCCICCTLTGGIAVLGGIIGTVTAAATGLFYNVSTGAYLTGVEYGTAIGGGTGVVLSSLAYLQGFYQLVQLSKKTQRVEVVAEGLRKLEEEYRALEQSADVSPGSPGVMRTVSF